ncbi:hypothetical protein V3C99_007322 [Haemonchus contortus]
MTHVMWNAPDVIFVVCSMVTLPVYFTILVLLIRNRKATGFHIPFYWLIISQGIADLFYLITYVTFIVFAYICFSTKVNPALTRIVTNIVVRVLTFCLTLRCMGVMLISFQRYTALCLWSSTKFAWVNKGSPVRFVAIQWIVSGVVVFPILPVINSNLGPTRVYALVFDAISYKVLALVMYISVFSTFAICIFCYGAVLRQIFCKLSAVRSTSKKVVREVQLCIQAAVFVFAFFILFVFYLYECVLILCAIPPPAIFELIHPVVSGFLSYVVPWTLLFFNKEVSALFKKTFGIPVPVQLYRPSASWTTGVK